jgi:hypothetical protein
MNICDMGTTGLVEYVRGQKNARLKALAMGRILNVYKQRGVTSNHIQDLSHNCFKDNCIVFLKSKLWRLVNGNEK